MQGSCGSSCEDSGYQRPDWLLHIKAARERAGDEVCICVYLQTVKVTHFLALTLKSPSVFGPHIVTLSLSTLTSGLLLSA